MVCRAKTRIWALSWCFLCRLGCSPVLTDQAVDDLPSLDPGGRCLTRRRRRRCPPQAARTAALLCTTPESRSRSARTSRTSASTAAGRMLGVRRKSGKLQVLVATARGAHAEGGGGVWGWWGAARARQERNAPVPGREAASGGHSRP